MNRSRVAVVFYEDREFRELIGGFLSSEFAMEPEYLDILTDRSLQSDSLEIYLVNSDGLGRSKEYTRYLRKAAMKCPPAGKAMFMLTRDLKAGEFLRNQELMARDTIDIGSGLQNLKITLTSHLLEKQLSLFGRRPPPDRMVK